MEIKVVVQKNGPILDSMSPECDSAHFQVTFKELDGVCSAVLTHHQFLGEKDNRSTKILGSSIQTALKRCFFSIANPVGPVGVEVESIDKILQRVDPITLDKTRSIKPWDRSCKDPLLNLVVAYYPSWSSLLPQLKHVNRDQLLWAYGYSSLEKNLFVIALPDIFDKKLSSIVGDFGNIVGVYCGDKVTINMCALKLCFSCWHKFCSSLIEVTPKVKSGLSWKIDAQYFYSPTPYVTLTLQYRLKNNGICTVKASQFTDCNIWKAIHYLFTCVRPDAMMVPTQSIFDGPTLP